MSAEAGQGTPTTPLTPGQLLSAAREQRGLTAEAVAERLRLSLQTVTDIEQDQYARIGVKTFVRGYLCAYARLVGLSEAHIMQAFGQLDVSFSSDLPVQSAMHVEDFSYVNKRRFPHYLRWGAAGCAVAMALVVALVLQHSPHHHAIKAKKTHLVKQPEQSFHLVAGKQSP